MKRILVPLDGSRASEAALPQARSLAHHYGAEVYLLRIAPDGSDVRVTASGQVHSGRDDTVEHCRTYLDAIAATFVHERVGVDTLVVRGHAAAVILEVAEDIQADLIVMSTQGRGGLKRALVGSVADSVIRHASMPVLVTRPVADKATPDGERVRRQGHPEHA